jgi:hypothetical protein
MCDTPVQGDDIHVRRTRTRTRIRRRRRRRRRIRRNRRRRRRKRRRNSYVCRYLYKNMSMAHDIYTIHVQELLY